MKFRVYDKQAGEYITGDSLLYSGLNTNGEFCYIDNNAELHPYDEGCYTVEQYTGFTDKNGYEAYYGDLIKTKNGVFTLDENTVRNIMNDFDKLNTADFEVTGTVHDANCSEKANS